jgi:hypothetical protein
LAAPDQHRVRNAHAGGLQIEQVLLVRVPANERKRVDDADARSLERRQPGEKLLVDAVVIPGGPHDGDVVRGPVRVRDIPGNGE